MYHSNENSLKFKYFIDTFFTKKFMNQDITHINFQAINISFMITISSCAFIG